MSQRKSVTFRDSNMGECDIVAFAIHLSEVFGTTQRGIAAIVRLTKPYSEWRRRVEWCQHCQRYVPVQFMDTTAIDEHAARRIKFKDHPDRDDPREACRGSNTDSVWNGAVPQQCELAPDALVRLLSTAGLAGGQCA